MKKGIFLFSLIILLTYVSASYSDCEIYGSCKPVSTIGNIYYNSTNLTYTNVSNYYNNTYINYTNETTINYNTEINNNTYYTNITGIIYNETNNGTMKGVIMFDSGSEDTNADFLCLGRGEANLNCRDSTIILPFDINITGLRCELETPDVDSVGIFSLADWAVIYPSFNCTLEAGGSTCYSSFKGIGGTEWSAGSEISIVYEEVVTSTSGHSACGLEYEFNGVFVTDLGTGNESFNQSLTDSLYAKYNFTNNNFNGSGNITNDVTRVNKIVINNLSYQSPYQLYIQNPSSNPAIYVRNTYDGTSLYKFAIDTYSATDKAFGTTINGSTQGSFVFYGDGKLEWGNGVGARDSNLYRAEANKLKSDDAIEASQLMAKNNIAAGPMIILNRTNANTDDVGIIGIAYNGGATNDFLWIGPDTTHQAMVFTLDQMYMGLSTISPLARLDVNGSINIRANETSVVCNVTNAGFIYYDNALFKHRGCNSTTWNSLY